jgi:SAM-dependent methyltransferase
MSERRGLWSPLYHPAVYEAFHHLIGARRWLGQFTRDVIRVEAGDRVLDVGCGPGALLRYLPDTAAYIGFDRNHAYIESARRMHQGRGLFICDDLANFAKHDLPPADVAVAIGILHHLDDGLASDLLKAIAHALTPRGRLITVDPCFHPDESYLQRFFMSRDRGMHVRPFQQYVALCNAVFPTPKATLKQGYFPFPHSVCVLQTAKPAERA